jgi:hypothetical protein
LKTSGKVEQAAQGLCLVNRHKGNSPFSLRNIKKRTVSGKTVDFVPNRSCLFTRHNPGAACSTLPEVFNLRLATNPGSKESFNELQIPLSATIPKTSKVYHANLNGDGYEELISLRHNIPGIDVIYFTESSANVVPVELEEHGEALTFVDLDGDGDLDIVTSYANSIALLYNKGDGSFPNRELKYSAGTTYFGTLHQLRPVDLNGDGILDLSFHESNQIRILTGICE